MEMWKYLDSGPRSGLVNMATDETLLRLAATGQEQVPVVRFYSWNPAAVSIGRFQNVETAVNADECRRRGIDIVRRVTGGRAVFHDSELTYAVVAPADHHTFPRDVMGTYKLIARGLLAGLAYLGIKANIVSRSARNSPLPKRPRDPSCFASPSWYEILVNGKKIIGSAQRRIPGAFLQHGSILIRYDADLESKLIPGGPRHTITCINSELGRNISLPEVRQGFLQGFSEAFQVTLKKPKF